MIEFSKANLNDVDEIVKVKMDAFIAEIKRYNLNPLNYKDKNRVIEAFSIYNIFNIIDDKKIIGSIAFTNKGNDIYYIKWIFILTSYQNKGIGTKAIKFLENKFPEAAGWTLETPYLSFQNHHFYEKMGYVKVGETDPDIDRNGFHLFKYEKKILRTV